MTSYINSDPEHEEEDPEAEEDGRPKGDQQLLEQISGELSTGHLVAGDNRQGHTTHLLRHCSTFSLTFSSCQTYTNLPPSSYLSRVNIKCPTLMPMRVV